MLHLYRILSYLLLPVAALFGLTSLIGVFMGLANPAALLPVFVVAGTTIYIVVSFRFLQKGIEAGGPCKPNLRDWVRVNGFVAMFFGLSTLVQSIFLLRHPARLHEAMQQAMAMQTPQAPLSEAAMRQAVNGVMWAMLIIAIMVLVHLLLTFRYLRQYSGVFAPASEHDAG